MPRHSIDSLCDGQTVEETYLVVEKQLRANRNAALYLYVELRDKTGSIGGRMWNVSEESVAHLLPGCYARVRAKVQLYQGMLQMILSGIQVVPPESINPDDFQRALAKNPAQMLAALREVLLTVADGPLRTLVDCFLADEALIGALAQAPAGTKAHHAYRGGLLEHVLNMLEIANRISDLLAGVDRDLLLVGIFLHDLGKTRELAYDAALAYTDEGQMLGHLVIGLEILAEKLREAEARLQTPFPAEAALRLRHMIISHHGSYEFGSPKLPMTPEAIALSHIDNLDAKVHEFVRDIADDPNPASSFTSYNARLERKLYKGAARPRRANGP